MGQQQLLLVILVTIIVGIATVVAINTFGAAADSANLDAVRQDMGSIAASAQGYYMKPEMLGGGGKSFENITFDHIAFGGDTNGDNQAWNENGVYVISSPTAADFTLTAHPASAITTAGGPAEGVTATSGEELVATVSADNMVFDS